MEHEYRHLSKKQFLKFKKELSENFLVSEKDKNLSCSCGNKDLKEIMMGDGGLKKQTKTKYTTYENVAWGGISGKCDKCNNLVWSSWYTWIDETWDDFLKKKKIKESLSNKEYKKLRKQYKPKRIIFFVSGSEYKDSVAKL